MQCVKHSKPLNTSVGKPKDIAASKGFAQTPPVWAARPRRTEIDAFPQNGRRYVYRFAPRVEMRKRNCVARRTKQALKQPQKHSSFTLDPRIYASGDSFDRVASAYSLRGTQAMERRSIQKVIW